jgi:hypothetical protein
MAFHYWWKEGVNIVNYRASAVFAQSPVLVILVNDKYERAKAHDLARVADWLFTLYALRSSNLLWQDDSSIECKV